LNASPDTRRARRARLAWLVPSVDADLFALRDALVTDPDAEVRRAAILRLDASGARKLLVYLRDATHDPSMLVREAAFVALARAKDIGALSLAERACRLDRGFRVRRMALLYAARTCGLAALPILALASHDPFWRVRVAVRRAGAALDAAVDTRSFADLEVPASLVEIDDPDPAVMAARLERMRTDVDARRLVALLGHSHQALRRLAVTEIAARGDVPTLREVLNWLRDERVPYGPAAAEATLARSGPRAATLAAVVLQSCDEPPHALAWALCHAEEAPPWTRLAELVRHPDARVRRAASTRLPEAAPDRKTLVESMRERLMDEDDETKIAVATWLARSGSRDAREALLAMGPRAQPSTVRLLLVDALSRSHAVDGLWAFLGDAHGGVRAAAASALVALNAVTPAKRSELGDDPDPWVRRAVLELEADDVNQSTEGAPFGRSCAAQTSWIELAARKGEPLSRARAATALGLESGDGMTEALLRLARDGDLGVRSAAMEALALHRERAATLLATGALPVAERIAAHTLLRSTGIAHAIQETDDEVAAHVALLDDAIAERVPLVRVATSTPARPAAHDANLRMLGRSGLRVQPFGLSGAHGLAFEDFSLARARGTNLFFWEPSHRELARFLRTRPADETVVVAGTYHADAVSIERDVVRTLRSLRRETIDVFLAFWTRSSARLDEVMGVLRSLSERGLIRAAGVSTHDRRLACEAADRGADVVMVRHNAAHRGAETSVFPHCTARGTGVLTFSNLCYGRMLHRSPAVLSEKVTAPDCYRYSLSQPGVHACIAAPRRHSELVENLAVVDNPLVEPQRLAELRAHGDYVYARSKAWSSETWSVGEQPRPRGDASNAAGSKSVEKADEALTDWFEQPESISPELW
jgi:aryl-alcohol dehydrogenase-like predicted oxidoreductase